MSEKIVQFPAKEEDRIWICGCGCQTFYAYEDGRIECAVCHEIGSGGHWRKGPEVDLRDDHITQTIIAMDHDDDFVFRRFIQEVIKPDVVAAALFRKEGSQRTVYRNEALPKTESERRWFRRRARRMLADLGADWKR